MAASIGGSASQATDASKARQAAIAYFKRVDRPSLIDPSSDEGGTLSGVTGAIEVDDVVFAYPTRPDFTICRGYSLSIGAGQTVALCGPSGSGKSTLVALLERFYDPQGGAITLDGVDIRTLNLRWLRSQLGLVGQEPVLFEGTVGKNIAYGKEGASEEEVRKRPGWPTRTTSSSGSRAATRRKSASAAASCRAARSSASPSRARCSRTHGCCCSTRRRVRSTMRASASCRRRSTRS